MWKDLSDEDKAPYVKMAGEDRARYDTELDAIPKKPKKALSPFMLFSNEHRPEVKGNNPDMSLGELGNSGLLSNLLIS